MDGKGGALGGSEADRARAWQDRMERERPYDSIGYQDPVAYQKKIDEAVKQERERTGQKV